MIRFRHDADWVALAPQTRAVFGARSDGQSRMDVAYAAELAGPGPRPRMGRAAGQRPGPAGAAPARRHRRRHRRGLPRAEEVPSPGSRPPPPEDLGDPHAAGLLRTALRIGFRSSAGPFRSLAAIAVEPRPYQLVPLLMALRQHAVRMLISDDVGIGKTIEAGLIAAELLAQGERPASPCCARRRWPSSGSASCATSSASTPSWSLHPPSAPGTWPGLRPVAVRPVPVRGRLHGLHQVRPAP